jgi:hypothetical protein
MRLVEYRILMPLTLAEFDVGIAWSVAEALRLNTGGGVGGEIIKNEDFELPEHNLRNVSSFLPECEIESNKSHTKKQSKRLLGVKNYLFGSNNSQSKNEVNEEQNASGSSENEPVKCFPAKTCQYKCKLHKVAGLLPWYLQKFAPKDALCFYERTWNCYPIIKTHITNDFVKDKLRVHLNTFVEEYKSNTFNDNALSLTNEQLGKREIIFIDISKNSLASVKSDPRNFKSKLTNRGPLLDNWWCDPKLPVICVYILLDCEFSWFGLQTKVESSMVNIYQKTFTKVYAEVFCWIDKWLNVTKEELKVFELTLKDTLAKQIDNGEIIAPKFEND